MSYIQGKELESFEYEIGVPSGNSTAFINVKADQLKENFGTLRFYLKGDLIAEFEDFSYWKKIL